MCVISLQSLAAADLVLQYGTWVLTDEAVDEPPKRLVEAMKQAGRPANEFVSIKIGETLAV